MRPPISSLIAQRSEASARAGRTGGQPLAPGDKHQYGATSSPERQPGCGGGSQMMEERELARLQRRRSVANVGSRPVSFLPWEALAGRPPFRALLVQEEVVPSAFRFGS